MLNFLLRNAFLLFRTLWIWLREPFESVDLLSILFPVLQLGVAAGFLGVQIGRGRTLTHYAFALVLALFFRDC